MPSWLPVVAGVVLLLGCWPVRMIAPPPGAERGTPLHADVRRLTIGLVLLGVGLEYTGLTLLSIAAAVGLDRVAGTHVLGHRRYWAFLGAVALLIAFFNGYLTGRPIVHYGEPYQLGLRVGSVPLEDFGYGLALVTIVIVLVHRAEGRSRARAAMRW